MDWLKKHAAALSIGAVVAFAGFSLTQPGKYEPCTGKANCKVCKNCSRCGHCAKQGGSCGVKKRIVGR
jgi:hypothetical protein